MGNDWNQPAEAIDVAALIYDNLCLFEFGIAAEVFGLSRPELGRELYRFTSVALEEGPLTTSSCLNISATGSIEQFRNAHTIIIPGWRGKDAPVPKYLCDELHQAHKRGARILSICSGVYVLAATGLLGNKSATTHWRYAEHLQAQFPDIDVRENALYVDEGNVITSAGSSAGIDACLHLVRIDYGADIANKVARRLVMQSHRLGNQAQFIEQPIATSLETERLTSMMESVSANLAESHTLASMSGSVSMSSRKFQRRFRAYTGITAKQWLVQQRIAHACRLIETTNLTMERISNEVGFSKTDSMRHHFRRMLDVSPNDYRKMYSKIA